MSPRADRAIPVLMGLDHGILARQPGAGIVSTDGLSS